MQRIEHDVVVRTSDGNLPGRLTLPSKVNAMVIFAHGSGSSRFSSRNSAVAEHLVDHGLATLLFDLLTEAEAMDRRNVFDIALLGDRMAEATRWVASREQLRGVPLCLFGASTGAAAALVAAAALPRLVAAVVSRGGRPDLADTALPRVEAPTLLIVGSEDDDVLGLNREAQQRLSGENSLVVIDGASHLFEEPGTLEQVATAAERWFNEHAHQPTK